MPTADRTLTAEVLRGDPRLLAELLRIPGAVLEGHFELLSGRHTDRFVAFSRIAADEAALRLIGDWLLPSLGPLLPDAVVAPRTAGVALGWSLARRLGTPLHLATVDAGGRPDGVLGQPDLDGQRILLVNDIVTTGDGFVALARAVTAAGGEIAGATWFMSRDDVDMQSKLGVASHSVATVMLPSWAPERCRYCDAGEPLHPGLDLN